MKFQKGHKVNLGKRNHLGFKHSEESKLKIGEKSKGRKVWNTGIPWPEEMKERISQTNKLKGIEPKVQYIGLGEKHWNWKKDRTKLKRFNDTAKDRRSYAYSEWRKGVWLRDNWKCRIANEDCSGRIEAHHILNYTYCPELRYDINNGITLCRAHHPSKRIEEKQLIPVFREIVGWTEADLGRLKEAELLEVRQ
jgi:hypothetical protein